MPLFAWIIIGILLLIALLVLVILLAKVQLVISYKNDFSVYAKLLFLKFKLYPEKEKPKKKKKKKATTPTKAPPKKVEQKKKSDILSKLFEYRKVVISIIKELDLNDQ